MTPENTVPYSNAVGPTKSTSVVNVNNQPVPVPDAGSSVLVVAACVIAVGAILVRRILRKIAGVEYAASVNGGEV
jgi:hypothetical protein